MWWSRALVCVMVLALGPAGCGFQPIYGRHDGAPTSAMSEQLSSVRVAPIDDRMGQKLRNDLVQTLNPHGEPANPRYLLTILLNESQQGMATSKDGNATVGRVYISVVYQFSDSRTGKLLYSGTTRGVSGYRYLGPRYASTVSEREAETSALTEISEEIRSALAAYFTNPETFRQRQKSQPLTPDLPPQTDDLSSP